MGRLFWFLLVVLLGAVLFVLCPQRPTPPVADYGDAPDSMDAGYYAPMAGGAPGVIVWGGAGTQGRFPTPPTSPASRWTPSTPPTPTGRPT